MKIKRELEGVVRDLAEQYRVVTITGPRQSGKTTLCKMVFGDRPYVSLENPDIQAIAEEDPVSFLQRFRKSGVILDEIQNIPELLSYIQGIVDEDEKAGQFILTGSHQFSLMEGISQSLAGRTAMVRLLPFSMAEAGLSGESSEESLFRGFYPAIWNQSLDPTVYYRNYFETYVQRDVRQMIQVKDLRVFRNFVRLCAGRVGQAFNASEIGNNLGVSSHTVKSWVSVLEASYIVYLMEPFSVNIGKRLVKAPKLYFYDIGFASYLLGFTSPDQIFTDRMRGALFENLVVLELLKTQFNRNCDASLYYYRDKQQHEIDVMIQNGRMFDCVEIKSSATFTKDYLKGISYFKKIQPELLGKSYLVYSGESNGVVKDTKLLNYKDARRCLEGDA